MPKLLRFAIAGLILAAVVYLIYASVHSARYRVEVCLSYHGLSACRTAEGNTQAEALRAAHDNACAQVTSGVTGTLGCQNTPAASVRWIGN
ncbi:MAG: hypothetical protein ACRD1E_11120 [Terriglobales bacterium]